MQDRALHPPSDLPLAVAAALWRGSALGGAPARTLPSGHPALDAVLPGGGWPCQALTEILSPPAARCEWRLLGPGLQAQAGRGGPVVLVGPPHPPHLPGLVDLGLREPDLVWIEARTPAERLWAAEQVLQSRLGGGLLLVWLPQGPVRTAALRRLQVRAQGCECPVLLFRPDSAARDASPAPLRVTVQPGADWQLSVRVIKRRGPTLDTALALPAVPAGLARVLPPRLQRPGVASAARDVQDALEALDGLEVNRHVEALDRAADHRSAPRPVAHH